MSPQEEITENSKLAIPIKAWVAMIIFIASVVFSAAMVYSKLKTTDDNLTKGLEKKVDKEEYERYKLIDSVNKSAMNRKLDLIMEHFKISDYGQEIKK